MAVIEVEDLARSYRAKTGIRRRSTKEVQAVKGVSFEVERGELFGLLGPNGAGKTTTIKMLITLLLPTGGTARVLGHDVVDRRRARCAGGSATSSAATEASTSGCPGWTTSATSPSCTASRRASSRPASASCSSSSA